MAVDTEIEPTGTFRVGMNANNATLVIRGADGTVSGLSADLGRFIAGKLGVPYGTNGVSVTFCDAENLH